MNRDFAEMLNALADESVEYLVVGAYAVAGTFFLTFSLFAVTLSALSR